jgi:hypothetical protein
MTIDIYFGEPETLKYDDRIECILPITCVLDSGEERTFITSYTVKDRRDIYKGREESKQTLLQKLREIGLPLKLGPPNLRE